MSRTLTLALSAAAVSLSAVALPALPAGAQTVYEQRRFDAAQRTYDRERAMYEQAQRRDQRRSSYNDPRYNNQDYDRRYATDYDATRYYRDDPRYQERVLTTNDQVYRGSDGRYYCKRNDGTTGLIIGGIGGAVAGNVIDGGRNRAAGTLIGGALGALLGKSIDQSSGDQVRCR